jgi:hypothetical protein
MNRLLLLTFFLTITFLGSTQDRKIDLLTLIYNQGHYRKVVRVSEKMITKKGYDKNPTVYLYQSAALAKLSQNHNYIDIQPNALDNSINTYSIYYKLDKEFGFSNNNEKLLAILREVYKGKIDNSNTEGALVYLLNGYKTVNAENVFIDTIGEIKDSIIIQTQSQTQPFFLKPIDKKLPHEDQIVCFAKNYLGIPYIYGGKSDQGFDCSGFTGYVLEEFGYNLPRSARDQYAALEKVPLKKAKKGDLVFFGKSKSRIIHVGFVISEEGEELTMLHASSSRGIMVSNVETNVYWKQRLISAGRIIK